jgi:hypothetical protein
MEIYNYYINTANKDNGDTNFNFNHKLGVNFHINENQKCYFKLINFSMMNSMLNISSYHKNNQFQINDMGDITTYTIPNGNYNITTLITKLNELTAGTPIAFNYESSTNSFYINSNEAGILFYPLNMKLILGFTKNSYNLIDGNTYGENFANLLPYTKLLITTNNLAFNPSTDNNLNREYSANEGINEIIAFIDKDEPPFSTLKYDNYNDVKFEIANKNFNYINLSIMNEYKEHIRDAPNAFYHFQIIISSIK